MQQNTAPNTKNVTEMLSLAVAAERAGVCQRTLRRAIALGELKQYRLTQRAIRVKASDLDAWIESKAVQAWR